MDSAASYCPRDIACNPPLTTSAIYAAVKRMMATCALRILLKVTPSGRKRGQMTADIKRRLIKGTPRISSIYTMDRTLTQGILDRRPSARITPKGYAAVSPNTERGGAG